MVPEDEHVIVFDSIKKAGQSHWLIAPVKHIRDVESLTPDDLDLCKNSLSS